MARRIEVELVGDSRKLERAFQRSSRAAKDFDRDLGRAGRGGLAASGLFKSMGHSIAFASASFLGGAGLVAAVKTSVEAASNLSEQMSKSNVVFGDSAASVTNWSKTTVNSMGLAQDQALETASSFGALLRPLGLTGSEAATQSRKLTQLGADLASFYNTSVQDALDAVRSGIVGESEPLRRYGVLLSETRVQQEAMAETGKKNAKQLTAQEKAAARITLIFKDTAQAQGDFQRTSQGTANQLRIFQANVRQLQIGLGTALLPALNKVVSAMNKAFTGSKDNTKQFDDLATTVNLLADAVLAAAEAWRKYKEAREKLTSGGAFGLGRLGFLAQSLPKIVSDEIERGRKIAVYFGLAKSDAEKARDALAAGAASAGSIASALNQAAAGAARVGAAIAAAVAPGGATGAKAKFGGSFIDLLNLRIDQAGLTKAQSDDLKAMRRLEAHLKKMIARYGHTLKLEQQLTAVQQQIQGVLSDQRSAAKAAAESRLAAAKAAGEQAASAARERAERLRQLREERQQRFLETGSPFVPSVKQLREQLAQVRKALGSLIDPATRQRLNRIGRLLAGYLGGVGGKAGKAMREQFKSELDGMLKDVDKGTGHIAYVTTLNIRKTLEGLGLTPAQRRALGGRLSGVGAAGVSAGTAAFAGQHGGVVITGDVHFHGVQNMRQFEDEVTKRHKARGRSRRGAR